MDPQPALLPTTSIENLPSEMIVEVLRQLDLPNLIHCRVLSKKFRDLIDACLKIRDLILFTYSPSHPIPSLGLIFISPNFKYQFQSDPIILESPSFQSFFAASLRSLTIYWELKNPSYLNKLDSLKKLYVSNIAIDRGVSLLLPNLEVLVIGLIEAARKTALTIDSMVLQNLHCHSLCFIRLIHYDSVTSLTILESQANYSDLSRFKKLQILKIAALKNYINDQSRADSIANLDDLVELHLEWRHPTREEIRASVNQTVQQIWTKKSGLRIFFFGVELIKENPIRFTAQNLEGPHGIFRMQAESYQQLSVGSPEDYRVIYYDLLTIFENRQLPADFFRKFCNIRLFLSDVVVDPDQFIQLVNSCKDLNCLIFNISRLDRAFFGRLSLNRLNLRYLTLFGENPQFDCRFILCLDSLWSLQIHQPLDSETVVGFYAACKNLIQLEFAVGNIPGGRLLTSRKVANNPFLLKCRSE